MKAIVTGHTKGLGEAIASDLLTRDIPVLGLARTFSDAMQARCPGLLSQIEIDLADANALGNWLAGSALRHFLAGDNAILLINNAGVVQPVGTLLDQDPLAVARAVTLNIAAPMMLSAAVVALSQGAERRILHVSSGAGRNAYPGWSVYCATKAALDQHARAVALDAVPGVRICSLAPGVIDTDMQAEIRATPPERFPLRERFVELERAGELSPPQQTARAVVEYMLGTGFGREPVDDLRTTR
ncbi:SDR family oxidoreductase [Massilia sp. GCM10020059]|uniref:SDR family oxidoreductase n=1 Tax=Massilia agrisoli TaxID=2892444 RepID=A0ABS8IU90_9BURK|nr:SDR family oxidoreductase [Massilia agrisoli]MCC6071985.1 SDR family oxidoreductase [Massilia agrisoli]